ncbi:tannase/feruloyl esterase family alpha/beta hydrolase [Sphaerotilus mobilis]|uniref:Feruloyl esterase n=1 Tax=Sphaerotilus mobilis TaxID=47994 RepID=A0A4Q7LHP2_9BURK|nr:tannase/feruloyl esterase family alpha/beta hydrolase [Sphaerotilus mobilis]RZS53257.1 feruloyl esterase [Sphaerotilus mobilis]
MTPTRIGLITGAVLLSSCGNRPPAAPVAPVAPIACAALPGALASLGSMRAVRLTVAREVEADAQGHAAHCLVQGRAHERIGLDGKPYAIGFEMRLPVDWNRRFVHQVNGGNDGKVQAALGGLGILSRNALQRGFAVISSDAGHDEDAPANASAGLAKGNVFGLDPQARLDYGYRANDTVFGIAQALMAGRYGQPPQRNYMVGCSNGGRHGMVAASRHGERYDGILAGAPGFNLPRAAVQHAWDVQSWQQAHADIRQAFSPADLQLVADHVLARCDALDGLADGIVGDLAACQPKVRVAELTCPGAKTASCLGAAQVGALQRSLAGPRNSRGESLYSDWSWDAGMGAGNWRFWKLESQIPPWDRLPLIATMGAGSLSHVFTTPPTATPGTPAELLAYLTRFDVDRDAPKIYATDGAFNESAMAFMTPPDVDDPKLTTFRAHGGKLLIYHGHSDAVFSVNDTRRWVDRLRANGGGDAVRFYGVPGMAHCSGGPATDQFDALGALVDWVERGTAPAALVATVNPANKDLPAAWSPQRSRLLCPHPQVARHVGGNTESADSFRCTAP